MNYSKPWIEIAVMTVITIVAASAADVKAEVELRAAVEQETVKGDLKGAIERYKKIAAANPQNRSVAARALFHIGSCYEKLGQSEAQKAYERLVREYPDQKDIAAEAQSHLAALGGDHRGPAPVAMRRLSTGQEPDAEGRPSPDGQWLTYASPDGDLAIYNLVSGERRLLKRSTPDPSGKRGRVKDPIWSPDGKQIAYGWDSCGDCFELRVMQADGTGDRTLYRRDKLDWLYPFDWSPDGRYIAAKVYGVTRDFALIDARTGEARSLYTIPSTLPPQRALFSPDGRYLAYDVQERTGNPNCDIWLLSLDGSRTPLVRNPGEDRVLAWLPDGVLFASDRTGTMDIWRQPVADGKPQGPPERLKAGIGNLSWTLGLTRKGSLYYTVRTAANDVFVAELDSATGKVVSRGMPVSQRHAGRYGYAVWSPDGRRLASIALSPDRPAGFTEGPFPIITIRDMATGEERDIKHSVPDLKNFNWTPDGHSLLASSPSGDDHWAIYKIDLQTGAATPLVTCEAVCTQQQLSPDGRILYYWERVAGKMKILALDLSSRSQRVTLREGHVLPWFALSPDGERIAFLADNGTKVLTVPAKGGEARILHEAKTDLVQPWGLTWSPDGRYVLFVERPDPKSTYELWRVSVQGGQSERLGLSADGLHAPRVNPDGTRITYSSGNFYSYEIWVLENFLPARAAR
jgi:Tol biopolymer transport system component